MTFVKLNSLLLNVELTMPIYEYQCTTCGKVFDHLQSIKSEPLTHCLDQVCEQIEKGKGEVTKKISGSGLVFNGKGFYLTDYVKKSGPSES
jgi:putative FmdB family regulatory protein